MKSNSQSGVAQETVTDPSDKASLQEEMSRSAAIAAASNRPARVPKTPGYCDWCEEETSSPTRVFCSADCRDADENYNRKMKIAGRRNA